MDRRLESLTPRPDGSITTKQAAAQLGVSVRALAKVATRRSKHQVQHPAQKAAWRVGEWSRSVGISRAMTYILLKRGELASLKIGRMRFILTPPEAWLAAKAEQKS
jgi:hypothetical protein